MIWIAFRYWNKGQIIFRWYLKTVSFTFSSGNGLKAKHISVGIKAIISASGKRDNYVKPWPLANKIVSSH